MTAELKVMLQSFLGWSATKANQHVNYPQKANGILWHTCMPELNISKTCILLD